MTETKGEMIEYFLLDLVDKRSLRKRRTKTKANARIPVIMKLGMEEESG